MPSTCCAFQVRMFSRESCVMPAVVVRGDHVFQREQRVRCRRRLLVPHVHARPGEVSRLERRRERLFVHDPARAVVIR